MQTSKIRDLLRTSSFLEGLTDTALHQLAQQVSVEELETEHVLFLEGAGREIMAIVASGSVAIEKHLNGRPVRLATLGSGEVVGEGILLDDTPHGTSARVLEPSTVLVLTGERARGILKEQPALFAALVGRAARAISRRLAATDATLAGRGRVMGFSGATTRTEKDLLGEREVPDDALYGVQTLRAVRNFPISGLKPLPAFIDAVVRKQAKKALHQFEF